MDTTPSQRPSDDGVDGPVPPTRPKPPSLVTSASATMMLIGIGLIAGGLFFVVVGAIGDALSSGGCSDPDCGTGLTTPIGLVMLAAGVVEIVAAVQLRSGRAWTWLVGVVLGVGGPLLGLLVLSIAGDFDIGLALGMLVPNAFVVYALVTSRQWFALRKA